MQSDFESKDFERKGERVGAFCRIILPTGIILYMRDVYLRYPLIEGVIYEKHISSVSGGEYTILALTHGTYIVVMDAVLWDTERMAYLIKKG